MVSQSKCDLRFLIIIMIISDDAHTRSLPVLNNNWNNIQFKTHLSLDNYLFPSLEKIPRYIEFLVLRESRSRSRQKKLNQTGLFIMLK